ncbi:MAG TPA: molybdopterin cofactor-binding domain-containing protein, partial [Pirellulales bacterium]
QFVQVLGAGLVIAVAHPLWAQEEGGRKGPRGRGGGGFFGGGPTTYAARLHIGKDGAITVFTGKVEGGQGARAELTQAAAEELRVSVDCINLVMADTALVPNDGITAGSGSTPRTVPAIRQGAAAARELLVALACKTWNVEPAEVEVHDGKVVHTASNRTQSYADLAAAEDAVKAFEQNVPTTVSLAPVKEWKVMGVATPRPNRHDLVNGVHQYPSDIIRPGMLYGKMLRAPSFGLNSKPAKLKTVDLGPAKEMDGVIVVQDGDFVGVVAPSSYLANQAIEAIAATAEWDHPEHPASDELFDHLEKTAKGGVPSNPYTDELAAAAKTVKAAYHVPYVQHCPMEPRAAVAEWNDNKLTVWTATQGPFSVRGELARALKIAEDKIRVITPDFGGGFGGKHTGECAVEAAKLAQAAGKPVSLRWTRPEEFTWAYFRPAGLIKAEATLDVDGGITSWYFINVNSGNQSLEPLYKVPPHKSKTSVIAADAPLRHGSYRALASTANTFAAEVFMDELAAAAGRNPLDFRLAHLQNSRLRAVLEKAGKQFDWANRWGSKKDNVGIGVACGTDKGSVVAACVEIEIDPKSQEISVRKVCEVFEAGAVVNPENLRTQVMGAIIMGLGPALREEMKFKDGQMQNAAFSKYLVPRFDDVPELDIHISPNESPSAGAGETPIIAIAPAIANAVYHATGQRVRQMPIRVATS